MKIKKYQQHLSMNNTFSFLIIAIITLATITVNTVNAQCIDEQFTTAVITESDIGQSFTVPPGGCATTLNNIILEKANNPNHGGTNPAVTATLYLYAGQTVSGSPLYTQTGIAIAAGTGNRTITVSGGTGSRAINPNNIYTFQLVLSSLTLALQVGQNNLGQDYTGGDCYFLGSFLGSHDIDMVINSADVLPVELTSFEGEQQGSSIALTWKTATEENNDGFEVQRKVGNDEWETLDFVIGNGTTLETQNYSYIDIRPLPGENYYRLKQMDYDGQFEYSNVIVINTVFDNKHKVFTIHPNPISNQLTITNGKGQLTIYNTLGQPVQNLEITEDFTQIPMTNLPSGPYFLEIISENGTKTTKRIIKE